MLHIGELLELEVSDFVGKSVAALGITGSGKTNTAAVLIEELLTNGLPLTIVDIEGEYYGLKEQFDLLIAGRSEHAELEVSPENASALATASVERGLSVILDLSDYTQDETYAFLIAYFTALWEAASKVKRPYQIVLEEAHEFIPQGANTPLKQIITRVALRGRKRGLGIILMSQRSAKVEKDVLTQTSLLFLHKVVHPTDMKVYKDLIPLPASEVESTVGALAPGAVVVVSNHQPVVAHIRLRHTFHAGSTPTLGDVAQPELRRVDASLLRDLQEMLAKTKPADSKHEQKAEKRIKELETLLAECDATIKQQSEQIAMLSKLAVQMPETMHIERATVNHLHPSAVGQPTIVESVPVKALPANSAHTPINESKLRALLMWLEKKTTVADRKILRTLHEHGRMMNLYDLASWSGLAETTIQKNPPTELVQRGLIVRQRIGREFHYRSGLSAFLAREFPGSDQDELLKRVFK